METDKYTKIDKSRASLILGAVGDALGAAVEFIKRDEILAKYGDSPNPIKGIQFPDEAYGKKGAITDDTQMTLFAADSLLSAYKRGAERGILGEYSGYTLLSYLRWLETQGQTNQNYSDIDWWGSKELFDIVKAQGQRGPGNTCLASLKSATKPFEPANNDSKGCGTVMRVAPIGIFFGNLITNIDKENLQKVYDEGVKDAAITHGNETAHHASGLLAVIIALVLHGEQLENATHKALALFGTPDVSGIVSKAVQLTNETPSTDNLQTLGQGWIAEEALAIALYCSLLCVKAKLSVEDALRLAVNHDGDSDSTGAIVGNLIGISFGTERIPQGLVGTDTEVASLIELLRKYGEDLVEIADYSPSSFGPDFEANNLVEKAKQLLLKTDPNYSGSFCDKAIDGIGYLVWQEVRGGGSIIAGNDGGILFSNQTGSIGPDEIIQAYKDGKRTDINRFDS